MVLDTGSRKTNFRKTVSINNVRNVFMRSPAFTKKAFISRIPKTRISNTSIFGKPLLFKKMVMING